MDMVPPRIVKPEPWNTAIWRGFNKATQAYYDALWREYTEPSRSKPQYEVFLLNAGYEAELRCEVK